MLSPSKRSTPCCFGKVTLKMREMVLMKREKEVEPASKQTLNSYWSPLQEAINGAGLLSRLHKMVVFGNRLGCTIYRETWCLVFKQLVIWSVMGSYFQCYKPTNNRWLSENMNTWAWSIRCELPLLALNEARKLDVDRARIGRFESISLVKLTQWGL